MAKLTEEKIVAAFQAHLKPGETLRYRAYGVKQPNILLIILLLFLGVLPGIIAIFLLTKNYLIALTEKRLIVLHIKGMGNAEAKEVFEYNLASLDRAQVKTSTGALFTHIRINDPQKPFVAKFHRAFSGNNRPHAVAIAEAITGPVQGM